MANPLNVVCTAGAWTKVITSKTNGSIINQKSTVSYSITTRDTTDAAPTVPAEGRRAFVCGPEEGLSDTASRDVYIFVHGDVDGLVEVTV
jgi:hypothetical protein